MVPLEKGKGECSNLHQENCGKEMLREFKESWSVTMVTKSKPEVTMHQQADEIKLQRCGEYSTVGEGGPRRGLASNVISPSTGKAI